MSTDNNLDNTFRWTLQKTYKFINLIKKHPQIWDTNSKHYRNNFQRDLAYDTISYEMGVTNTLVKKKIHTLRSQYLGEIRKMRKNNTKKSNWTFFNNLKFIFQNRNFNNSEIDDNSSNETESIFIENNSEVENDIYLPEKRQRLDLDENDEVEEEEQQNDDGDDDDDNQSYSRWPKADIFKLIKLYRQYPMLYDTKSPLYHNQMQRRETLKKIAKELNTTVDKIRNKIHTLRSSYRAEIRKMKSRNSNECTWPFFNELKFLYAEEFYKPRTLDTNVSNDNFNDDTIEYLTEGEDHKVPQMKFSTDNKPSMCITCEERDEFTVFGETVATELRLTKDCQQIHKILKRQILEAVKEAKESINHFAE